MFAPLLPRADEADQSRLFEDLRWRLLCNTLDVLLRGSLLRVLTIILCSAFVWTVVYFISKEAFAFLILNKLPLTGGIVATIFDLLFLLLTVLLIFSSAIILYGSLFASPETTFLLSTPLRADHIFAYKYQGALAFSSWGFLLLGSPVLVAHGLVFGAPWYFYPLFVLFILGFVILPGSVGALLCLLVVNFLPRRKKQVVFMTLLVLAVLLAAWVQRIKPVSWTDPNYPNFVQRLLGQLSFAQGPLAPNHWMSRGLLAVERGDLDEASFRLALVWGNGLFLYLLTTALARRLYRRGYDRLAAGGLHRRRYGGIWFDRALDRLVGFLDPQTRLLIIKDFRTFRRDPSQWAQVLIFTGLMALYFTNMRHFYQGEIGRAYQNGVSVINLIATALLLCSYTGRFIYPMLSLEGRKFWVLGLLPLRRERLLWGKFAFSATWSLLISEFLIVFSDTMLGVPRGVIGIHALTVAVLAFGLSGLSVGLGAWMPNFRESDPSKIAVGFGGTLNLVACLLFLLAEVLLMAAPWHLRAAYTELAVPTARDFYWLGGGVAAGLLLGLAAVLVPLRLGARTLRQMEF